MEKIAAGAGVGNKDSVGGVAGNNVGRASRRAADEIAGGTAENGDARIVGEGVGAIDVRADELNFRWLPP